GAGFLGATNASVHIFPASGERHDGTLDGSGTTIAGLNTQTEMTITGMRLVLENGDSPAVLASNQSITFRECVLYNAIGQPLVWSTNTNATLTLETCVLAGSFASQLSSFGGHATIVIQNSVIVAMDSYTVFLSESGETIDLTAHN